MATIRDILRSYLAETGWTPVDLQRRSGLTKATTYALLRGTRGCGYTIAQMVERATVEAYTRGETQAAPLRAIDLVRVSSEARGRGKKEAA